MELDIDAAQQHEAAIANRATGLALQADAAAAAEALARLPDPIHNPETAAFRERMMQRFGSPSVPGIDVEVEDAWVAQVVSIYVTYWHQVLTKRKSLADTERDFLTAIAALLGRSPEGSSEFDELEAELETKIRDKGFHVLLGRTLPLIELMLWKSQTTSQVEVQLPEGTHPMTVTYMDEFILRGWGHYATCGRRSTGGWATEAGLFAVVPAYKRMDDEVFTVRFLAHEAQHSIDLRTYANLESWELEYRAKLTEVVLGHTIQPDTLKRFCENRSDATKEAPHAYANFMVIRALEQRLTNQAGTIDLCGDVVSDEQAVRDIAKALLIEDSQARIAQKQS